MSYCSNKYPSLRWGMSTLGCPQCNLPQALEIADRYGIEFLEIRTLNNTVDCQKTLYYPENEEAMRCIAAAGRCRVLDSSFGLTADAPDARDALLQIARTADDFGIPYVRVFGGGNFGEEIDNVRLRRAAANVEWFQSLNLKTKLALETHDICSSAKSCRDLQKHLGYDLPIIWDAHHTRQLAEESFADSYRLLGDSIVGVHFKDSHYAIKDGTRICEYDRIGEGIVPLDELFSLLEQNHCQVPVILEHEKYWRKYLPEIDVMLDSWRKYCNG